MNRKQQIELLKQYLNGDLTDSQTADCERFLASSANLRCEFERLQKVQNIVSESSGSFEPFFATHVMARVNSSISQESTFAASLNILFKRFAIVTTVMIVCFASYNIATQWEYRQVSTPLELALALPPTTVESSITYLDFEE